ncbi:hypothetical protein [Spirosoma aerolatum]|uniref:hypothetical protein n=1 Tax=Spirosoma aerolatum TaxID=1211326 RepID=UPI0009AE8B14|nr:hypothetical protein [Spirosoma aerolatum]
MNNNLVRSILAGVLLGAALFIMPFFLLRVILFFILIGTLFRLFGRGHFRRGGWRSRRFGYMPAFADRIRQMSDDEYNQFKQRFEQGRCGDYSDWNTTETKSNEGTTTI